MSLNVLFLCFTEKMITSEALEGVPILVLANKQDVEVKLLQTCFLNEQLGLEKLGSAFALNVGDIPGLVRIEPCCCWQ